jgi:hypothetical protein
MTYGNRSIECSGYCGEWESFGSLSVSLASGTFAKKLQPLEACSTACGVGWIRLYRSRNRWSRSLRRSYVGHSEIDRELGARLNYTPNDGDSCRNMPRVVCAP